MMPHTEFLIDMQLKTQLKALIKQKGVTVTTLAKTSKVPAQTLHSWMSVAKPRDFDQVKRAADYFQVSIDFLAYGIQLEQSKGSEIEKHKDEIYAGIFEVVLRRPGRGNK